MPESSCRKPDPAPYSNAQVRQWMAHVAADAWYRHQMPISHASLSAACGYMKNMLALSCASRHTPATLDRVARVINSIEARRLCFLKYGGGGKDKTLRTFYWLELPVTRPCIRPLDRETAWSLWAYCDRCGSNKFMPIRIQGDDRPSVACYSCLPPDQYPSIGAVPAPHSLIHQALKKLA